MINQQGTAAAGYCTGMILRYWGPVLEQAPKGNGTLRDWVWFGG
jgi:hypothetical protein